jgi:NADP-dependent 3-hydroxy acid dehydrogenase YdfG
VTGASGGIGLAICRALASAGASVLLVARRAEPLRAAARAVGGLALPADVTDAGEVERLRARAAAAGGSEPEIVVGAAGAFELGQVVETPVESFDRMLAVNLRAPFLLARAFLPGMLARRAGHFVTIGSVAGRVAFPENGAYSASKFGVRGLHAVLDAELRGTGVRATLVEPGATDTALWDGIDRRRHRGLPERAAMLAPEAVAAAVMFAVTRPPGVDVRTLLLERT